MRLVDFVTMASTSTRNTDNPRYKGGNEEFQAIRPNVMTFLCEKLLGYGEVSSK